MEALERKFNSIPLKPGKIRQVKCPLDGSELNVPSIIFDPNKRFSFGGDVKDKYRDSYVNHVYVSPAGSVFCCLRCNSDYNSS